jgi:primosomal protein N' (replication factor Y) (superfamily II helicase)
VTGSGKTEVYIHALKHALEQGRGGLVLVPEIALTPQTVQRFFRIFGDQIAVLHSRLSERERFEAWQSLRSGEKRIAIGPRSAVFAPVK